MPGKDCETLRSRCDELYGDTVDYNCLLDNDDGTDAVGALQAAVAYDLCDVEGTLQQLVAQDATEDDEVAFDNDKNENDTLKG